MEGRKERWEAERKKKKERETRKNIKKEGRDEG